MQEWAALLLSSVCRDGKSGCSRKSFAVLQRGASAVLHVISGIFPAVFLELLCKED